MNLVIKDITITGFKGYKDTVKYDLGEKRTIISGDNGLGKTSVGEAIVWCITGCNLQGNEKATNDLINDSKPKLMEVVLDILLDGKPSTIIRRKKGATNEVYWDDHKSSTNELAQAIFKGKDLFLSIVNPYYFSELTPKAAKQLLGDILKPINREEIFIALGDYLKKILLDNGFRLPETFLADKRSDLKEQDENIIYLEGVLDGLKPVEVFDKKTFDNKELKKVREEFTELNKTESLELELSKIDKPKSIDKELADLRFLEIDVKKELLDIALKPLAPVESLKLQKDVLLSGCKEKKARLDNFESKTIKCDSCGNEIDLTKETKELLKQEIEKIKLDGVHLKDKIEEIEKQNAEIEKENQKLRDEAEKELSIKLDEVEAKRQALKSDFDKKNTEYESKRQSVITKFLVANEGKDERIDFLKSKIAAFENEEREIVNYNAEIDGAIKQNEKLEKDIEVAKERIQNSKNKIEQIKLAIEAGKQYNSIKLKKQSEQIKPFLKDIEIVFEKLTKDGELKDDFKIKYKGLDFGKVSDAQKIKASLEISNLLMNIQDLHFPIFIDRAESINEIPKIDTQIIEARVSLDKEIKVEVVE